MDRNKERERERKKEEEGGKREEEILPLQNRFKNSRIRELAVSCYAREDAKVVLQIANARRLAPATKKIKS